MSNRCMGSISLVLSILMVPMLTFASLMVDSSSIAAAEVIVDGASELAINAALADYDSVLKERYGIYAMSQLGEDYRMELNDLITYHTASTLQTSKPLSVVGSNVSAQPVVGSNLTNPEVLRRSIVDFMKYRGVMGVGASLYGSLEGVLRLGTKARLVDKQVEAGKELDSISKVCAELYSVLRIYDEAVSVYRLDPTGDFPHLLLDSAISLAEQIKASLPGIAQANDYFKAAIDGYLEETGDEADSLYVAMSGEYERNLAMFGEEDPDGLLRQLKAAKEYIDGMLGGYSDESGEVYLKRIDEAISIGGNFIGVPPFYIYLMTSFGGVNSADQEETSLGVLLKNISKLNESAKTSASVDEELSYSMHIFEGSPSGENTGYVGAFDDIGLSDLLGVSDQLSVMTGAFLDITALIKSDLADFRDNILVTEYVMKNFSSHSSSGDEFTYTGYPIDPDNNRIYGCEAEYIIFGNKGSEEKKLWFLTLKNEAGPESNIASAKRAVFAVRFSANSVFAFSDSSIDALTLAPAMSIQAVSGGTVPFQTAQLVLKLALALGESAIDLAQIVNGEKVPLFKTASTWRCSINGFIDMVSKEIISQVEDMAHEGVEDGVGMIQKCIDGLVDHTNQEIESIVSGILKDVGVVAESQLRGVVDSVYAVLKNRAELELIETFKGGRFNPSSFVNSVTIKIEDMLKGKVSETHLGNILNAVANTLQNQLVPILSEVASEVTGTSEGISLHDDLYGITLIKLSEAIESLVELSVDAITTKTSEITHSVGEEIKEIIKEKGDELGDALARELAEHAKVYLDYIFSFSPRASSPSLESVPTDVGLLNLDYEDYIRLFLFLNLCGGDRDMVMLRIADIVQLNTSLYHSKGMRFRLNDSYTQVEFYMDVEVRALLIPYRYRIYGGEKKYYATQGY